jgi:hypothetical protein
MVVMAATGIELCPTGRAFVGAVQIFSNGHGRSTNTTQYGYFIALAERPSFNGMAGQRIVTVLAGIVDQAALHLDGDDIQSRVIVNAARLGIDLDATDYRTHFCLHQ